MKLAFIGLGIMGGPMAAHLARSGHDVTVYNRTPQKTDEWLRSSRGRRAESPREAAAHAEMVFTCVTDDAALRAVVLGTEGALAGMRPGAILIDHSSASPAVAREIAAAASSVDIDALDAPVTGGQPGAQAGTLGIMVGGAPDVLATVEPVLRAYAKTIMHMGPSGSGHITKMVNVICAGGMGQAVAEALNFAMKAGLNIPAVLEVLGQGSSRSWVLEHKGPTMMSGDYRSASFSVDLILKDIQGTLAEARRLGAGVPLLGLLERQYAQIRQDGGGDWDTASLIHALQP